MKTLALLLMLLAASAALGVDVEGYVYTVDGTPVSKAAITAGSQRATTSDDGHFKLSAPADSIVRIEVRADNLPPAKILALAGDPPLTITLGTESRDDTMTTRTAAGAPAAGEVRDRVITGVVRIGKRPLANAPVFVHGLGERYYLPLEVTSDDKGRYRATVSAGRYTVAIGEGLAPRLRWIAEEQRLADVTEAREASIDIELAAAPLITGRVLDADQKPVARADVMLVPAGRPALESFHEPIVRSLPDGRFAVPAQPYEPSEPMEIVVTAQRSSPVRSKPFTLAAAKSTTIILPRFESVTVQTTGGDGKALGGASVAFAPVGETANTGGAAVLLMPHAARRRATTDANGQVVLHLEPGEYDFAAAAPKHQQRMVSRSIVRPTSFDIALEAGHQITGRVRRGKQPIAGVHVALRGGNAPRGESSVTTGEKGEFLFDALPPDTYTVGFFDAEGFIDRIVTVETPAELDIDLPPLALLRGRIIDAGTGETVPHFSYSLESLDEAATERARRGHQTRGYTREDGTFVSSVPVGTYRMVVAAAGFIASEPREVRVTPGEPSPIVEIALSRGASVTGRVTDQEGKPVAEAQVMVVRELGEIQRSSRPAMRMGPISATTGEDGAFTLTGVETGRAQLIVRRSGFLMERRPIDIEPQTRVEVTLARGITISGIVTLNGKPIAGANIDATTSASGADHQTAVSDARGRYTLEGLLAARYAINANFGAHYVQIKDVDVNRQREVNVELEGAGHGIIFGTVSGLPRGGGAGSVLAQSTERGADGRIDPSGNYRIANAPAGAIDVMAQIETPLGTRSTARKRIELSAGETVRVDLDLTPAIVVTGRVTHGASKPVPRAHISFSSENGVMVTAMTREDGMYEVGLPEAGRYHVFANAQETVANHHQTIVDIRGSETLDIHFVEQRIEGLVLDTATGQPVVGAMVTLVARAALRAAMQPVAGQTVTDSRGRFTLPAATSGPHLLIASANGYGHRSQDVTLGGGEPIRAQFDLNAAGELRVRVIDAVNATPLEAHLVVSDEKGIVLPVQPARGLDGAELIFSLAPGRYKLKALAMGYKEKTVEVTAPGAIVIPME